jgi:murein DD-endopeptidase MepM/ murein hydrolase activator NlpD
VVADGGAEQAQDEALPPSSPAAPGGPDPSAPPEVASFNHLGPSDLIPASGPGYSDRTVWAPKLCFPLEDSGYANSQVWSPGGGKGPSGSSQCDPANYNLPWRDNFCESRSHGNIFCPGGTGHQGQDIRAKSCKKNTYWARAAEAGTITNIGSYSVTLTGAAPPHLQYRYLHLQMDQLAVSEGAVVQVGDHIGRVSNVFGSTPTTIHLHFEIRAGVAGTSSDGQPVQSLAFLPPYLSLAQAYERKLAGTPCS